ncbi:hypothetical protein PGTUg99_017097 [Puccinia graminis f. sp. tritici]|nr:hypothetical protein PGTUg99_017097 [Puccinia graminis f. sp. tritici]
MHALPPEHRNALLIHESEVVDDSIRRSSSVTTKTNPLGLRTIMHKMEVERDFNAKKNLHFVSQGAHTEVEIEEHGIRPHDFDSDKKFRTATAREQIEGTAVNYFLLDNFTRGIREDLRPAFLEYLAKSDGKDQIQSHEQHYSGADLAMKYQRFLEDRQTLALTAPPTSEDTSSHSAEMESKILPSAPKKGKGHDEETGKDSMKEKKLLDEIQERENRIKTRAFQTLEQLMYPLQRQKEPSNIDDPAFMQFKEFKMLLNKRMKQKRPQVKRFVKWMEGHHEASLGKIGDDDWFTTYALFWNYCAYIEQEKLEKHLYYDSIKKEGVEKVTENNVENYFSPILDELLEIHLTPVDRKLFKKDISYRGEDGKLKTVFPMDGKPEDNSRLNPYVFRSDFAMKLAEWHKIPKSTMHQLRKSVDEGMTSLKRRIESWTDKWKIKIKEMFTKMGKKIQALFSRKKSE